MPNSYRIRTQVGVDKSVRVLLEQDFEQLEILSLKILQNQIYTRQCSDYGVIVGRISANDGFGLPNCKVSIFIPLTSEDERDPVISELYPYRTVASVNEDGFRYNLLPYTQSHSGHVPTGSFPDREDVLTNPSLIEVYNKYYKYTTQTNDSGDYMIFGVPVGVHAIHVDIDLSDIGEFSLSPQDLIRMGLANESQVAGVNFKKSTNLNSLPQILTFNRSVTVEPFWGETEICTIGITRSDFDITREANISITPTAIFMGSIFSSNDKDFQKVNCKPKIKQGELCNLVAGPGEILAIRQTIGIDSQGRPVLETFDLDAGGQVIDDNGTWLLDVPMNLDYVITNEFGERVLSNDPKVGIPTKGKYRFKIKWNQSPKLSEPIKRAYFLVPNIREYGWDVGGSADPLGTFPTGNTNLAMKSYAFSLDWNDYANIQAAINCEDTFYLMSYNKVYSVSQLIDQYKNGYLTNRIIAIRNILDDVCESDNVRFPTNDTVYRFDLLYLLFVIAIWIFRPVIYILLVVAHIVAGILFVFGDNNWRKIANMQLPNLSYPDCDLCECNEGGEATGPGPSGAQADTDVLLNRTGYLTPFWSYSQYNKPTPVFKVGVATSGPGQAGISVSVEDIVFPTANNSGNYIKYLTFSEQQLMSGRPYDPAQPSPGTLAPQMIDLGNGTKLFTTNIPIFEKLNLFNLKSAYFNGTIPRFWSGNKWDGGNTPPQNQNVRNAFNPWGGGNRIRVSFNPTANGYPPAGGPTTSYDKAINWEDNGQYAPHHFDNVLVLLVKPEKLREFAAGNLVTFQSSELSGDPNITGSTANQFGTNATVGTTINGQYSINVEYAKFDNTGNNTTTYIIDQGTDDFQYMKFPTDVEYFQVITGLTVSEWLTPTLSPSTFGDTCEDFENVLNVEGSVIEKFKIGTLGHALFSHTKIYQINTNDFFENNPNDGLPNPYLVSPACAFNNLANQGIVILVRGVDPYSTRGEVEYDLSAILGGKNPSILRQSYPNSGAQYLPGNIESIDRWIIRGNNYKLNIPINGKIKNVRHEPNVGDIDINTNQYLYYPSYHFRPNTVGSNSFIPFTSKLPNYYSLLDINTQWDYLTNSLGLNESTNNSSTNSQFPFLKLDSDFSNSQTNYVPSLTRNLMNGFQVEFKRVYGLTDPYQWSPILNGDQGQDGIGILKWNSPNINFRSYWSNQIVEGGTFMNQRLCLNGTGRCHVGPSIDPNEPVPKGASYYYAPSYLLYNRTYNYTTQMASQGRIVMRSDRLPTSTSYLQELENTYPLFSNPLFTIYNITDEGTSPGTSVSTPVGTPSFGDILANLDDRIEGIPALDTFTCQGMIPLRCYYNLNNEINVRTKPNGCYENGGNGALIMEKGCYVLISEPFVTLFNGKDFEILAEWTSRIQITFAACRNVFSHIFTNNWINGSLYAFSFSNLRVFDSVNQPSSEYCHDTVVLHPTNNFYYRSSPVYNAGTINNPIIKFVGANAPSGLFGSYNGNIKNLKFPTTMIDLGPRNDYMQELIFSDEFDGYMVNRLNDTTYQDVSEMLNLLIINRLTNTNFLERMFGVGGASVNAFFDSRKPGFIDGDYSQMISISSELGVVEFESSNYLPIPLQQDPIYFSNPSSTSPVFGIFFSSDSQTRDYVTPKRTIINPSVPPTNQCAFNNFTVFSQLVPFYQWEIKPTNSYRNIFGSQGNDWYTDILLDDDSFFQKKYQELDRTNSNPSRYFKTNRSSNNEDYKGYIYSYNRNTTPGGFDPDYNSWAQNTSRPNNAITVGAPFHFYFGLKKGKTSWDRFVRKWINTSNITE